MDQAFNALLQFNERTVIGKVSHLAFDDAVGRVAFGDLVPGVVLSLLHAERKLLAGLVNSKDRYLDFVAKMGRLTLPLEQNFDVRVADNTVVILTSIAAGYFLMLIMERHGLVGRARLLSRLTSERLYTEFV